MFKRFLEWCLDKLMGCFDRSMDAEEVHALVMGRYARLSRLAATSEILDQELTRLENLLLELGWIEAPAKRELIEQTRERRDWQGYNWLAEGDCFGKDGIEPGCGQYLDWMDSQHNLDDRQALAEKLEKLLRQVEVKREKALWKFTRETPREQQHLERCDISILFSRAARRNHDLRFLNAALKMNEWFFREIRNSPSELCITRLLTAMAEQEISARELLEC